MDDCHLAKSKIEKKSQIRVGIWEEAICFGCIQDRVTQKNCHTCKNLKQCNFQVLSRIQNFAHLYQISHVYERIHSNEINGIKKSNV
jgi:hypothetical protein